MSRKVAVTEALRKDIRHMISILTPDEKWYLIARSERESVPQAYLRVDENGQAEEFSDDQVTALIYTRASTQEWQAGKIKKFLTDNNLWVGAKLRQPEEEDQ